jgi:hypothetical protein
MIQARIKAGCKYHGEVADVNDPKGWGRIRVEILGFEDGKNITPWCHACAAMAGSEYGLFMLPQPGDHCFVELMANGYEWVASGFHWSERKPKPMDGAPDVRVLRMPGGQQILFDNDGNIEIDCPGNVELKGDSGKVVSTDCICSYTGGKHVQGVTTILIKAV